MSMIKKTDVFHDRFENTLVWNSLTHSVSKKIHQKCDEVENNELTAK